MNQAASSVRDAVLAIDGALGPFSVALVSRGGAFEPRALAGAGGDALERGLALVRDVLGPVAPASLERIVVTTGPGSFTGLRIAVAYAKSLAYATGVPLVGVDSFDVIDPGFASGAAPGDASLAAIPSRAGRANVRLRADRVARAWGGAFADIAAGVAASLPEGAAVRAAGVPAGLAVALAEHGVHVISVPLNAPLALAVATRGLHRRPLASPHALAADYGQDGPATVASPAP